MLAFGGPGVLVIGGSGEWREGGYLLDGDGDGAQLLGGRTRIVYVLGLLT